MDQCLFLLRWRKKTTTTRIGSFYLQQLYSIPVQLQSKVAVFRFINLFNVAAYLQWEKERGLNEMYSAQEALL